jgi:hypothetical protein
MNPAPTSEHTPGVNYHAASDRLPWTDLLPAGLPSTCCLRLARQSATLLVGDHLNHFDLRPDNLLIGRGTGEANDRGWV